MSPVPLRRTAQLLRHFSMTSSSSSAAPWRSDFLSHVQQMDQASFNLATLHRTGQSMSGEHQFTPRTRTVIYRGLWADLPVNPKNTAELNPAIYETDLPTITTDARMEKVPELFSTASGPENIQSGKGGPVEACFWVGKVQTQWRLRGHAYIIGPDIDTEKAAPVRTALEKHMRPKNTSAGDRAEDGSWSFGRELTAQFGNLSPGMRGSFKNPLPGSPLSQEPGEGLQLGQKVEDLQDRIARANFRVLVVVPEEVDRVDLTDPARGKRWNYKYTGEGAGAWKVTECWP